LKINKKKLKILLQGIATYKALYYLYLTIRNNNTKTLHDMTTSNNTTANKMSDNTLANLIAFGIMAVIVVVGVIYGIQLDAIGY
jgi:ABC-type uncharacterized transport system permease subunit